MASSKKKELEQAPVRTVSVPLHSLNSKPVHEFAQYQSTNGRSTALRAFKEREELDFEVRVNKSNPDNNYFEIIFETPKDSIDSRQMRIAELLLAGLRNKWEQGRKINLENARDFIDTALEDIQEHYTEEVLGDNINVIFASALANDPIALKPLEPSVEQDNDGKITTKAPKEISLVEAGGYQGRGFDTQVPFSLTQWHEDDQGVYFPHINEIGETRKIYPTENQQSFINAMRDPDVKVVLLQAPTGAGKTLFSVRVGLELLKMGAIKEFLHERPTETTGGNFNPYLKGGMDEKFGVFSAVLEEEMALQLGHGDVEKGLEPLNKLKGKKKIKRYDQMYQRGDTLRYAFLLGDEMQNKDAVEIFHLISRPGEGAKVVLVGDSEFQTDLQYGRKSGFQQAFDLFSNPDVAAEACKRLKKNGVDIDPKTVTTLQFGSEDIKRDPHTAFVYEVSKIGREIQALEDAAREEARKDKPYEPPHPSERYSQHQDRGPEPG